MATKAKKKRQKKSIKIDDSMATTNGRCGSSVEHTGKNTRWASLNVCAKTTFYIFHFELNKNTEQKNLYRNITPDISVIFFICFLSPIRTIPYLCVCMYVFLFFFSSSFFLVIFFSLLWLRLNSFSLMQHSRQYPEY